MKKFKKGCLPIIRSYLDAGVIACLLGLMFPIVAIPAIIAGRQLIPAIFMTIYGTIASPLVLLIGEISYGKSAYMHMTFIENGVQVRNPLLRIKYSMTWDEVADCGICYAAAPQALTEVCAIYFSKEYVPPEKRRYYHAAYIKNSEDFIFIQYREKVFKQMLPYLPEHIKEKLIVEVAEYKAKGAISPRNS
ncbi:MAG: hypothetical protein E7491_07565 [Ruminococcaceae bacterium]|nr:hypothetical protein [Oscillospiraceae bacterium]